MSATVIRTSGAVRPDAASRAAASFGGHEVTMAERPAAAASASAAPGRATVSSATASSMTEMRSNAGSL